MHSESSLRERLVDVGVDLVLSEGSASLGLREIARRAGVSHGAPRRYFPTHHALLSAIARRGFADLGARFATALADATTARDQLQAVARAYVGYALECRGMFELMFRHELLDSEQHGSDQPRLRESTLPLFEHIVALVARCRAEQGTAHQPGGPDGTATEAAVTAAALWSNLHGIAQLWAWGSLPLVLDAQLPDDAPGVDRLDQFVAAVLDTHLGPVSS
ncbi:MULTISPECIES: TetR/AcrR family transcriptional regulator [Streptomyces]|uniref:TetR/AcrR family transcriptional regulator n=1 Tax=Streptomyces TaxID=1883 RepID=UPI001964AA51|nr:MULTISPECIES: TetR/AcrR family transcriptional regulator [Streptomyces]QRX95272.1 TetR/AcrR family transcriptional regulator [Streptomyces noursei]UJB45902.1 TetR/AcrR family transcriptional regulator [Streptomyces sp. A1-5]